MSDDEEDRFSIVEVSGTLWKKDNLMGRFERVDSDETIRSKNRWCAISLVLFTSVFGLVSIILGDYTPLLILFFILVLGGWCSK